MAKNRFCATHIPALTFVSAGIVFQGGEWGEEIIKFGMKRNLRKSIGMGGRSALQNIENDKKATNIYRKLNKM